jgi:L,D-peptidoglycan transpeptidase YkuD (ErfK/YbiS/YcfS/YnhG family)
MHRLSFAVIRVRTRPGCPTQGWLAAGPFRFRVALGRSGIRADKREGDGTTPRGSFRPVRAWWRADRGLRPATRLPVRRIRADDAWCENPADRRYNRPIRLCDGAAGDRLWREDRLYDLVIEIDHNRTPRVARRGSAVFLHVARPGLAPTAGCIALPPAALRRLLRHLGPRSVIEVR